MTASPPSRAPGASDTKPLACPRCQHSVRYKSCPNCRLRLYCRACDVRLTDPLHQTVCDVCGETVEPGAWLEAPGGLSPVATATPPAAAPSGSVPPATGDAHIEAMIGPFHDPGSVRRQAASYAAALVAHDRFADAIGVLDDALASPGPEPPDARLLLLRGHGRQSIGQPLPALQDLLAATEANPGLLPSSGPSLQRLLLSTEAGDARAQILNSWGPRLEPQVSVSEHLLVCLIELQAAVLQNDVSAAQAVVGRTRQAHPQDGAGACAGLLAWIRLRGPAEARLFETLARTEVQLGETADAIADIDRAIQLGRGERGATARLLEFKAGIVGGPDRDANVARVLLEAGKSAFSENDSDTAIRLLSQTWALRPAAETGWYLADALRVQATEDPGNQDALLEALQVAGQAAELAPMAGPHAWAHGVLAQIHLNLSVQDPLAGTRHLLLGALGAERRLLLEDELTTLAQLAEAYRKLDWHALCADAARQCRAGLEDRLDVLWSLGYAELEAGADAVATWADILQHPQVNELMRAAIYFLLDRKDESLAAFRAHSDLLAGEPSIRLLYARLLREMDLDAEARAEFEALRELAPGLPETIMSAADRAFVSYALGDYATALDLLKPALDAGPECSYTLTDVAGVAMLCHLAQGDVSQAVVARDGLLAALRNAYDGDEVVTELVRLGSAAELTPEVAAEITESAARIRAAAARISEIGLDLDAALGNLRHMIDDGGRGPLAESQAAVAALASSRLLLRQARWADAGHACVVLLTGGTTAATEEPACIDAVTGRLFEAADQLIRGGGSDAGLSLLEQALPGIRPGRRHEALLRMVLVNLADGRPDAAQKFAAEIQDVGEPTVASVLQAIAPDVEAIYRIAARAEQARLPGLDQALLRIAEDVLGLNHAESDERTVAPILIEIGEGLLTEDPPADGPLFRTQLPALRDRVCQQTGVWLPGVLIRVVPGLPTDRFRVSAAGQWPELGELHPGMVYVRRTKRRVLNALGSTAEVIPVTDPVSGKEACWVRYEQPPLLGRLSAWWKGTTAQSPRPAGWKDFIEDTGTWDDPLCYPLAVLERFVIARLSCLVTADEMAAAAERWRQGGGIDLDSQVIEVGLGRLTLLGHDLLDEGFALIPRPGSGAELERILSQDVPYPEALAAARDVFTSQLPGEGK